MVAIAASADFVWGDYTFNVQSDGTATIFGFKSGYTGSPTSITIPGYCFDSSTQKYYKVKTIGPYAFSGKTSLQRVTIQYGVEAISTYAFNGCTSLSTVDLPSSIKSFADGIFYNAPITRINCAAETMPTLNSNAFYHLGTVSGSRYWTCATPDGKTAADAVSLITSNFSTGWDHTAADFHAHVMGRSDNNNLYDVYLNVTQGWDPSTQTYGKLKLLGANSRSSTTNKTLKIGQNQSYSQNLAYYYVTRIDKSMRYRCSSIETLDMSETNKIDTIDANAFYGCTALTKAIVSAKVIGSYAFYNCTNLKTLQLYGSSESSQGVQMLYNQCFAYTGVTSVYIPSSLTTYGGGSFAFCSSLTKFTVSSSNNYFAADTNSPNCLYDKGKTTLYQMGGGTKPSNMVDLSSSLPNTLIYIGIRALAGAKLSIVDIPYGVKSIDHYAFSGMPNVQTIRIPSSVTFVASTAFSGLTTTTLKHVYINLKQAPSDIQSTSAFSSLPTGVTLHVPLWRTNYYTTGSWWSGGWGNKFTAGVVEDAYDFTYNKAASGNYVDYVLRYTVSSAGSYTDTYVQSAAVDGQLTVVGAQIGAASYFNGTITFANTVVHRGKTYIITEVQREVFRNQTLIKQVTGGAGIKKIGALSFAGLTGCTNGFYIPNPIEFCDSSLFNCWTPTISLGSRLTTIGKDAFRSTAVQRVIMPTSVTKIGARFLANSRQLDSLRLSPNITEIPTMGLSWVNCRYIVIPYGVKKINSQAFMSDQSTVSSSDVLAEPVRENIVIIPSSVTSISSSAFKYARHLDAIFLNVPYGVFTSTRDDWQRRNDYNASNAYDWDGHLLYVPYEYLSGYRGDSGIKAVFSEDTYVRPGAFDFYRGTDLWTTPYRMTVLNASSKTAKYVVNGNAKVETNATTTNFKTTESNSWNGQTYTMTEIGDGCMDATIFYGVVSTAGSGIEENQCENYKHLVLPSTITRIGDYAFRGCSGLQYEVDVPESVSYIGQYAFYDCKKLPSIFLNRTSTTTIGNLCWNSETNFATDKLKLYVPLKQYNNIALQTQSWVPNKYTFRRVLPYLKPTTEWSTISVPVNDAILLPESGDFYYVESYNSSSQSVNKTALENTKGIKGAEGMLFKGTVGTIYRFREAPGGTSTPAYIAPSNNHLLGVPYDYNYVSYSIPNTTTWYYMFDGTKFNKKTSAFQVYSGDACLQLHGSDGATASITTVYIDETSVETYDLWINGTQVTSGNASNLSVIDGVSGTVKYTASTNILTLTNATITTSGVNAIKNSISGLKIAVSGTNQVKVTSGAYAALSTLKSLTMQGTGTLNCSSTDQAGIRVASSVLTIKGGVQVKATGKHGTIGVSSGSLVMSGENTKLTSNGTTWSYYQLPVTFNDGLGITAPTGAVLNSAGTVVNNAGTTISGQDVVFSKLTSVRGDINGDGKVDVSDVNIVINIMLGKTSASSYPGNADVNGDGKVDVSDVNIIINIMLGKA